MLMPRSPSGQMRPSTGDRGYGRRPALASADISGVQKIHTILKDSGIQRTNRSRVNNLGRYIIGRVCEKMKSNIASPGCLIPEFDGALFSLEWREDLIGCSCWNGWASISYTSLKAP